MNHLSFSQIKSFRECEKMWYCKSVLKEETAPSEAANRGTQFDQMVAHRLGLGNAPTDPLIDRVEEAVSFYLLNGGWDKATEAQKKIEISPNTWDIYREIYGVDWLLPAPLVGYVDLFRTDETGFRSELVDLKTSERAEFRPEWSLQCSLYALVTRAAVWHVHLLTFTKLIKLMKYSFRPSDSTFSWAMNIIGSTADRMKHVEREKTVSKIPATPGYYCRWCSRGTNCEGSLVGGLTA